MTASTGEPMTRREAVDYARDVLHHHGLPPVEDRIAPGGGMRAFIEALAGAMMDARMCAYLEAHECVEGAQAGSLTSSYALDDAREAHRFIAYVDLHF